MIADLSSSLGGAGEWKFVHDEQIPMLGAARTYPLSLPLLARMVLVLVLVLMVLVAVAVEWR